MQPLLVLLDDLHWADRSSLLLLHPLALTASALSRERGYLSVGLHGLSPNATSQLIGSLEGSTTGTFADAVHAFTDGNPLFVREVVRDLAETGRLESFQSATADGNSVRAMLTAPEGVRSIIRKRIARLSADVRACYRWQPWSDRNSTWARFRPSSSSRIQPFWTASIVRTRRGW